MRVLLKTYLSFANSIIEIKYILKLDTLLCPNSYRDIFAL